MGIANLSLSALAALVLAVSGAPSCPSTVEQANFDELPNNSVLPGPAIPVGYKGLYWQTFIVANTDDTGIPVASLQPESPINYAATISATELQGPPLLSTNYKGSKVSSFSLASFYFGCAVNLGQGAVGVPAECTLTLTGYRGKTNNPDTSEKVCSHEFTFKPKSNTDAEKVQSTGPIKKCTDMQFAVISYTLTGVAAGADADNGLAIDNVRYTTKSC